MGRISLVLCVAGTLAVTATTPGCKSNNRELSTLAIMQADTLEIAPGATRQVPFLIEDAMRRVAGYEDSVTLLVDFDMLDSRTLSFYVVDVPNYNLWIDSRPFEAVAAQAYVPSAESTHFSVANLPDGAYYVIFDNRGDTLQGRTAVHVDCRVTFWKHTGAS